MAGIAMGTNNITNVGTISGSTNSRSANNIVSHAGVGPVNNVVVFSSDKVIQDSGRLVTDFALNDTVALIYLPKAGGTMTGGIDMGANSLFNASSTHGR